MIYWNNQIAYDLDPGSQTWYMSPDSYVKAALKTAKVKIRKNEKFITRKAIDTLPSVYLIKLWITKLFGGDLYNYFQSLSGIL